jgi:transposase
MVAIPTKEEARRPSRGRASLVDERSRITNRMKSALARFGIRGFKPHLRKAPERLAGLRTAEGTAGKQHRGAPARHGSAGTGP